MKLTYFNMPGRAYVTRTCFKLGGIEYEEEFITFAELKEGRGAEGSSARFPLGSVPVLTLPDGKIITQSGALARYAAKLAKLYPEDPLKALLVDEFLETCADCLVALLAAPSDPDPEVKKAKREEFAAGKLKIFFNFFANKLASDSTGPFVLGSDFSVADIQLYALVNMLRTGFFDHVPSDYDLAWPVIGEMVTALEANERFSPHKLAV